MSDLGLVSSRDGCWQIENQDLGRLAVSTGAAGRGDMRREAVRAQRQDFNDRLRASSRRGAAGVAADERMVGDDMQSED